MQKNKKKTQFTTCKRTKTHNTLSSNFTTLKRTLLLILLLCLSFQSSSFFTTNSRFALNSSTLAEKTISNHAFNTHQHYIIAFNSTLYPYYVLINEFYLKDTLHLPYEANDITHYQFALEVNHRFGINGTVQFYISVSSNSTSSINVTEKHTIFKKNEPNIPFYNSFLVNPGTERNTTFVYYTERVPDPDVLNPMFIYVKMTNLSGDAWVSYELNVTSLGAFPRKSFISFSFGSVFPALSLVTMIFIFKRKKQSSSRSKTIQTRLNWSSTNAKKR